MINILPEPTLSFVAIAVQASPLRWNMAMMAGVLVAFGVASGFISQYSIGLTSSWRILIAKT